MSETDHKTIKLEKRESVSYVHEFSESEKDKLSRLLPGLLSQLERAEEEEKNLKAQARAKISKISASIKEIKLKVESGKETRACHDAIVELDFNARERIYHHPNGFEISRGELRESDFQKQLKFE